MGNWHISIQGIGCHHNPDIPQDADRMSKQFVQELVAAGHHVSIATFTHGGAETLHVDGEALLPRCDNARIEALAGLMYERYCTAVGGKAHDGGDLPSWEVFRADPKKKVQSDAWITAAQAAVFELRR